MDIYFKPSDVTLDLINILPWDIIHNQVTIDEYVSHRRRRERRGRDLWWGRRGWSVAYTFWIWVGRTRSKQQLNLHQRTQWNLATVMSTTKG